MATNGLAALAEIDAALVSELINILDASARLPLIDGGTDLLGQAVAVSLGALLEKGPHGWDVVPIKNRKED